MIEKLIEIEMKMLHEVSKVIASHIAAKTGTMVNEYGVCHQSQPLFQAISRSLDASNFAYCIYFAVPVDTDDKVILPENFFNDTKKFRSSTASFLFTTKFQREEYYDNLISFEQLASLIEERTEGGNVFTNTIIRKPLNSSLERIMPDANGIEDLGYLIAHFYTNGGL